MTIANRTTIALSSLMDALNIMGSRKEREIAVRDVFARTHRTLQQQFVSTIIVPILRQLADDYASGYCDGRNMEAGRLATRMLKDLTDDDLYLPLI